MTEGPASSREDELTTRARARVGQVLREKWRLDQLLGVGGMASVYAASHRNGKRGAVKMLHLELSGSAESRARFLREGYVANKVEHPGAVSVLDDDVHEGAVFLVMELLEGETVEARAQARPGQRLPVAEVVRIADGLLDVLAAAHDKGIVHRDLKPENLFLTTRGEVKVLDFGIARFRDGAAQTTGTRTGSVMGTPAFMPPEQALGNTASVDARSDLWAVGATMYNLLTGRTVHEADTLNKLLLAAMTLPAPPLASAVPGIPPALAAVVDQALAFNQAQRWPDARSMRAALAAASTASALSVAGAFPPFVIGGAPRLTAGAAVTAPPFTRESIGKQTVRPARSGLIAGFGLGFLAVLGVTIAIAMSRGSGGSRPAVAAGPEPGASSLPASTASTAVAPVVVASPEPPTTVEVVPTVSPSASAVPVAATAGAAATSSAVATSSAAATSAPRATPTARPATPPRATSGAPPKKKDLFGVY